MTLISELMTMICGFDCETVGLDEFLCVIFAFLGRFGRVFGFLGIRAIEFCDASCAVGCITELRVCEALNHAKRTSDATGKAIQPEDCQKA